MEHENPSNSGDHAEVVDVAVVGGGLSGLVTAALLARGGASVRLFEKASTLGGRASTQRDAGVRFNLGPHAVYLAGPAYAILRGLGVEPRGGVPRIGGSFALHRGQLETLPGGFFSLLTTGLLGLSAKMEIGRLLARLEAIDVGPLAETPLSEWIDAHLRDDTARQLARALFRVSTYANDDERQSAGAAFAQLQLANARGVLYVDGGWGNMVTAVAEVAKAAGVVIELGAKVTQVAQSQGLHRVELVEGRRIFAKQVVAASTPIAASTIFPGSATLVRHAAEASPVRAACLDVALTKVPRRSGWFALGIDVPLYASVHTRWARLVDQDGPDEGAVVHLAKYLSPGDDGHGAEAELTKALELLQPGASGLIHRRRFLPRMTVTGALVQASQGGLMGRPSVAIPEIPGAFVVGDWVGARGMLLDAALASAEMAATQILAGLAALDGHVDLGAPPRSASHANVAA